MYFGSSEAIRNTGKCTCTDLRQADFVKITSGNCYLQELYPLLLGKVEVSLSIMITLLKGLGIGCQYSFLLEMSYTVN